MQNMSAIWAQSIRNATAPRASAIRALICCHLFKAKEMLAMRLCVMHNLYFYNTSWSCIATSWKTSFRSFKEEYTDRLDRRI